MAAKKHIKFGLISCDTTVFALTAQLGNGMTKSVNQVGFLRSLVDFLHSCRSTSTSAFGPGGPDVFMSSLSLLLCPQ